MNLAPRRAMLFAVGGSTLLTTGRIAKPPRPANADGTYCFRIGKRCRPTLRRTLTPIPSERVDVAFVEMIGRVWAWGSTSRLELGDVAECRQRASSLRLVADIE